MDRFIKVTLEKHGVSCLARLLDSEAPRTASAVWDALPLSSQVFHGKYARNEIYHLVPAFAPVEPGPENTTVTPIPGDLCYFTFNSDILNTPSHGYGADEEVRAPEAIIDLALFYGRNNLLLNGDQGWVPGNVFATVVEGLEEMATACQSIWMDGARGETLAFSRHEPGSRT
ncbi:hypothetical protein D477_012293 [Arthrobacter crystallopoietes BAB-32]|uniref:DUF3830 domain-containing protein n=1 Tax=Arthrobacter crystallopoietes BAB-32 TaxID=1246476 RepID=N1UU53_9MICC|nr:DUF3830 family protein [Arthrobacter crystallopoietes]EMY33956.1 hypothetical protein D477_012293 [Arthrobacter crystallopoietes BAB-32]